MIINLKKYILDIYNSYHIKLDYIDYDFFDDLFLSDLEMGCGNNV